MITCLSTYVAHNFVENRANIMKLCVSYLLKTCSASEFHRQLKQFDRSANSCTRIKALRMLLKRSAYTVQNLRAFLYGVLRHGNATQINRFASTYCITRNDVRNCTIPLILGDTDLIEHAKSVDAKSVMDLEHINARFSSFVPELLKFAKARVSYKLYFISTSCNEEINDLVSDVMTKIVESYYWMMPCPQSDEYVLNYLRRSILNHVNTMIEFYKANKRSRLVEDETRTNFNLVVVSENQSMDLLDELVQSVEQETDESVDNRLVALSIIRAYRGRPKAMTFISLLMGKPNDVFTKWLKQRKAIGRTSTNEDLLAVVGPQRTVDLISEWMAIPVLCRQLFMHELRKFV